MRKRKTKQVRLLPVKKLVAVRHKAKRKMATKKEEKDEQEFFAGKVKEQAQHEGKEEQKMADKKTDNDEPKTRDSVAGYSGSAREGRKHQNDPRAHRKRQ